MKKLVYKDMSKRNLVSKFELKKNLLKSIYKNSCLTTFMRLKALNSLINLPKNGNLTRVSNRCIITGRNSKNNKHYRFSRLVFLRLAKSGHIAGIRKSK